MKLIIVLATLILTVFANSTHAQDYPTRLIKLMHGFGPGGNVDVMARLIGEEIAKIFASPIVVDTRPGQVGNLAAEFVAKSEPDGYTLLLVAGAHPVIAATYKNLKYHPVDDFAWISTVSVYPFVICVRKDSKFQTLGDLLAAARTKAGAVTYGSSGLGSVQFMTAELLGSVTKVKFLQVFYRGEARAMMGLLSGDVDFIITTTTVAASQIQSGLVRGLGVTSKTPSADLPGIPTVEEAAGVGDFKVTSWSGLAAPAKTPRPIIDRLHAVVQRVIDNPVTKTRIASFGGEPQGSTPAEMRDLVETQLAMWRRLAQEANIQADWEKPAK
ncbi:MAG: tripartite tricarboxylate transporter substrate binding protein [Hyphomicrobiales bacterium]|nr:tripartite tricarboxylate transporter substrate binding protein [Hyphomicrobiales bacterium]